MLGIVRATERSSSIRLVVKKDDLEAIGEEITAAGGVVLEICPQGQAGLIRFLSDDMDEDSFKNIVRRAKGSAS